MSQHQALHKAYFESPAGLELLTSITALLDSNHTEAENQPEHSRDHMQRAKGNREVMDLISGLVAERKKPAKQS